MRTLAELGAHFSRGVEKFQRDPWEWFLLVGDRLVLAAVLATAFLTVVVTLFAFDVVNATSEEPMLYLFSMLAGGNITLLTIVLSINQLVLTRQLKTPGEVSAHIENAIEYRMEVETQSERETVPVMPTEFLGVLLANARANARKLDSAAQSDGNGTVTAELTSLADSVVVHTNYIEGVLDRSQGGIFSALAVTLETNYSKQLNAALRLKSADLEGFPPETKTVLEDLVDSLRQIDVARQYFKTVYIQDELARLSRLLLYVGVPTVGSSMLMLLIYTATDPVTLWGWALPGIVGVTVVLGFVPMAVLFSFLLRIATVAKRTAAITPFTTPQQERTSG